MPSSQIISRGIISRCVSDNLPENLNRQSKRRRVAVRLNVSDSRTAEFAQARHNRAALHRWLFRAALPELCDAEFGGKLIEVSRQRWRDRDSAFRARQPCFMAALAGNGNAFDA